MSGGRKPDAAGDVYFAFYTMAMRTGHGQSAARIAELCADAGFDGIKTYQSARPYVTQVVTARRK